MRYKWLLSLVLSVVMLSAEAQFRKIPAEVTDSFETKFNDAAKVSLRDNITSFQASFKQGDDDVKAFFSAKEEWLKTETKLYIK